MGSGVSTGVSASLGGSVGLGWLELAIYALGFGGSLGKVCPISQGGTLLDENRTFSPSRSTELLFMELDFGRRYSDPPAVARGAQCCPPWGWWAQSGWAPATRPALGAQHSPAPEKSSIGFPVVGVGTGQLVPPAEGAS